MKLHNLISILKPYGVGKVRKPEMSLKNPRPHTHTPRIGIWRTLCLLHKDHDVISKYIHFSFIFSSLISLIVFQSNMLQSIQKLSSHFLVNMYITTSLFFSNFHLSVGFYLTLSTWYCELLEYNLSMNIGNLLALCGLRWWNFWFVIAILQYIPSSFKNALTDGMNLTVTITD